MLGSSPKADTKIQHSHEFALYCTFSFRQIVLTKYTFFSQIWIGKTIFLWGCDLYTFLIGFFNIWLFWRERKRRENIENTMGGFADYQRTYVQVFKIMNFGTIVCMVIRFHEQFLDHWVYDICVALYCITQLILANAMSDT